MQPQPRSALRLLLVGLAAGACTDQTPPTAIPPGLAPVAAAAGANNQKVNVKAIQLSSNTLRIDGPSVIGNVKIGNSGLAILTGVSVRAEISQGTVSKEAVNAPVQCSPGEGDVGKLPIGTCETSFTAVASNSSASPGVLTPGSATFTLHVLAGDTELASKSQLVNLVGAVGMTVTIAPTTVLIDGPASTATAIIQNPAKALQGVLVQGWIVQGAADNQTRRPTGQSLVTCGSNAGILPAGTCTMTLPVTASNVGEGVGLFASGAATFELDLIQTSGSSTTTLDVETASVTMVWGSPHFTRAELQSTTVEIGGPDVGFTVDMQNGGAPLSGILLSVQIIQFTGGLNFINKDAGSIVVSCGSGPAELPTTGTGVCTMQSNLRASDDINGGAFTAGPAVVFFDILGSTGTLDRKRVDIMLTEKPVRITNVTLSPTIPLASGSSPYAATIQNSGSSLSNVVLNTWITQGTARRAAGGQMVQCGTGTPGELPTGSCSVSSSVAASNDPASGNGLLVPGPATLEIDVEQQSGPTTILAKRLIPVTLVISGPTIINIELSATDVVAGQELTYNVTFYNPTASTISGLGIQGLLTQGTIVDFGTGGFSLQCPGAAAQGDLPPGACTMPFLTLNTRNIDGIPTWQLGPATWRLLLSADADGAVLSSQTRTINFIGLQ
jgi:hypothetical protein